MKANRIVVLAMACACLSAATPGQTQTTNTWVIPPSTQDLLWNDTANWTPGTVPNGNTHWAVFEGDYKTDVTYTARLGNDITLAGLSFFDTTTANYPWLTITNTPLVTLTWDGGSGPARITVTNAGGTTASTVQFHSGVTNYIGANGLIKDGPGSLLIWRLAGPGNLTVDRGTVELRDNNLNFSGALIITNSGGLDFRGSNVPHAGGIGNQPITIYNSGIFRYRESSNVTLTNSFILRGIHQNGSLYFYQTTNITYTGTVRLETNSSISLGLWEQTSNSVTHRKDVFFSGKIEDDGNNRNLHLVNHQAIVNIGPNARLSRFVLSGTAEHGGFTHLTGSREPEPNGTSDFFLQLTNGNNRLPTGTTLYLGGRMTSGATTVGAWGASGILILAGSDQELAGLVVSTQGTGVNNRVVGGVATNNTLTLNIAAATTNLYSGFLGGTNTFENNLALTKKGSGTLRLSAATNTFSGLTTVEAGTLVIAGNHPGGGGAEIQNNAKLVMNGDWRNSGLITVNSGGTLGGTGIVGSVNVSGTLSPGNSMGTLTSHGDVLFAAGSALALELGNPLATYDRLVLNGGTLSLDALSELTVTMDDYSAAEGDTWTIVSGFTGWAAGAGAFAGKANGSTFIADGNYLQIDYTETSITLTAIPEPGTLGILGFGLIATLLRRRMRKV